MSSQHVIHKKHKDKSPVRKILDILTVTWREN